MGYLGFNRRHEDHSVSPHFSEEETERQVLGSLRGCAAGRRQGQHGHPGLRLHLTTPLFFLPSDLESTLVRPARVHETSRAKALCADALGLKHMLGTYDVGSVV